MPWPRLILSRQLGLPALALLVMAGRSQTSNGQEIRDTRTKSANRQDILQRFVAECVMITPGQGVFPDLPVSGPGETVKTRPFRVSKYETTQELYQAITGVNPSRWKGPRNSVETVSWQEAMAFCRQLTAALQAENLIQKNEVVRLPTSAEWEYCCRAGSSTRYSFGDDLTAKDESSIIDQFGWHSGNAAGNDPAVGVLKPNAWGLHDVHGYLWEYVADRWMLAAEYSDRSEVADDATPPDSPLRVIRGGSWRDDHRLLTCASKLPIPEYTSGDAIGFRCVVAENGVEKDTPTR